MEDSMNPTQPPTGRLLLVPNALDFGVEVGDLSAVIPLGVLRAAAALQHWAVEDARSARAFLKRVDAVAPLCRPLQELDIQELPRPRKGSRELVPAAQWLRLLAPALGGGDLGLLSEAGLPAVADPGAALVAQAHRRGVEVVALSGPSSLILALAASGLNGQSFAFTGYLPQEPATRIAKLRELEGLSRRLGQTQLMIETPYRNRVLLSALLTTLSPSTDLSISCGLTLDAGWTRSAPVERWRAMPAPPLSDRLPAVFALLAH
jgi:16S rRNA (cytidine1402-2'-O)-methyltransferase